MAYVKEKIGKRLGLLKRTTNFFKARTLFYNSISQPIRDYGAVVWGSNNKRQFAEEMRQNNPGQKMGYSLETSIQRTKYLAITD